MVDLPNSVPVFRTAHAEEAYSCAIRAGRYYNVSPYLIQTVLQIEGGVKGSKVRNSNGTYDYGPMQINTIWINELKRMENISVDKNRLINDVCYNIHIGAWIIATRINEVNGDVWRGVGNYHSKTPQHHNRYLGNARKAYSQIISHWSRTLGVNQDTASIERVVERSISRTSSSRSRTNNTIQYSIAP